MHHYAQPPKMSLVNISNAEQPQVQKDRGAGKVTPPAPNSSLSHFSRIVKSESQGKMWKRS